MDRKLVFAMLLFSMFVVGLQSAQPVDAYKQIDQFNVYHFHGQSSDMDLYKTYQFDLNHFFITSTGYNWNSKLHKYVKCGTSDWMDFKKYSAKTLRIKQPGMDTPYVYTYIKTPHSASYYYWYTARYKIKHNMPP